MNPSRALFTALVLCVVSVSACSTLPEVRHEKYKFPEGRAFLEDVKDRPYEKLGLVRARVDFPTLDPNRDLASLCPNYYNKAVNDLVKTAREKGGDAVLVVRSVVFLEDGRTEAYAQPECSDEGAEGQILVQGVAVKWKPKSPVPAG